MQETRDGRTSHDFFVCRPWKTNIDGAKAAIVVVASLEDLGIEEGYKCGETRREAVSKKVKGLEHGGVNATHSSTCDVCVL